MQPYRKLSLTKLPAVGLAVLLVATGCSRNNDTEDVTLPAKPLTTAGIEGSSASSDGFNIRLSEGMAADLVPIAVVDGQPLSDAEISAVLGRLPEWDVPDETAPFNRPAESLTPPLVGATVDSAFPPAGTADPIDTPSGEPLEVLRFQPEGDVDVAPYLTVTFNQPMVALATLDHLDEAEVPVQVSPTVPGRWRWIGTRTLRFEVLPGVTDRLPMATEYTVTVPKGTESASGATLAEGVSWTFTTPPAVPVSLSPESDSLPTNQVFALTFDQVVEPEAVLAATTVTADGDKQAIRIASPDEITDFEPGLEGRVVYFRSVEPLPTDAALAINVGPDTPSAEGPITAPDATTFSARTYAPLRITSSDCGYGGQCEPSMPWSIQFNNSIEPSSFSPSMVTIEPELPGSSVVLYDNTIQIAGASQGQTEYTITVDQSLTDIFGQSMEQDGATTIKVGNARPSLRAFDRQFVTLDPLADNKGISVTTVNHPSVQVTAWAVEPTDYAAFVKYLDNYWNNPTLTDPDFTQVFDEVIDIDGKADRAIETFVDLSDALSESSQLVVRVSPLLDIPQSSEDYWQNQPSLAWVQSTDVGVDAIVSNNTLLVWTTSLATGKPLPNVDLTILGQNTKATTDADGLATVNLSSGGVLGVVASVGTDIGMLPSGWYEGWQTSPRTDEARWYIFDDRGVYKPSETVQLKGWIRRFTNSTDAQLAAIGDGATVKYTVYDGQGIEVSNGTTELNGLGGFNLSFDLPAGANLGQGFVYFELLGATGLPYAGSEHYFKIDEFRTPEFEVTTQVESPAPYYANDGATVGAAASYYSGGALPNADVEWSVTSQTTSYTPPNRDDYSFGIWRPWWFGYGYDSGYDYDYGSGGCCFGGEEPIVETFAGATDGSGKHFLRMDFTGPEVDQPTNVTAQATVFDVNRQAWSSQTTVLVHPAAYYVGIRSDRPFVEQGTKLSIEAIVTDVDGTAVSGREVVITAGRLVSAFTDGAWTEEVVDPQTCTVTSTSDNVVCDFETPLGGSYQITAVTIDDDGQSNRSQLTRWVSGGTSVPTRGVTQEQVTIIPDAENYAPGDTAELLVQAPFSPASGVLTVSRNGIESSEVFDAPDGSAIVTVPIADDDIPNLTVLVEMVGTAERTADDGTALPDSPPRPAYATGQLSLPIPPVSRTLAVDVTPAADQLQPGDDTSLTVTVRDADGNPVSGADVAIVVVDEAVLSLTGYQLIDPLDVFYRDLYADTWVEAIRATILLNRSDLITDGRDDTASATTTAAAGGFDTETTEAAAADSDGSGRQAAPAPEEGAALSSYNAAEPGAPIDVRSDFSALAVYAPNESTDASGNVTVDVPLPDNLTRYRAMAVAVNGDDQFGKGEATITARLPLMVRPSAPRFLNFGDQFELPIVVQNQTNNAMSVDVAIEFANLAPTEAAGKRVTVPANDRVEVRFATTTESAGTARFRVAGVSGDDADSAEVALPVYTPATAEAFATYGVVDDGAVAQPVVAPTDVYPQFGGLEIDTSSTAVQALTDAVLYLTDYRYDNADGYATRILAVASLQDVLDAFDADGLPDKDALQAKVQRDIAELVKLQSPDGGFVTWRIGDPSDPFASVTSTHALVEAKAAGYTVPSAAIESALGFLQNIEEHVPASYSAEIKDTISAYALNVRHLAGDSDPAKAEALYSRRSAQLQLDAIAWLWPVIDDGTIEAEIERTFTNAATETAGAASFATSYGEDAYLIANSDRRTDGVILDALISERPNSDLIPKVVAGLLGNQIKGRWNNAYENSFILLAMNHYFQTFESVDPSFVAQIWLGETYAGAHTYDGRTTDRGATLVPMSELVDAGDADLILSKDGPGRLYYRLGLRYAPADLQLAARDEGFVVDRVYEAVNDEGDVRLDDQGVWHIKAGATVRIKLTMVADAQRTNMALIDPLPAGLEVLSSGPSEPGLWWWDWRWYQHENLRDDRAEAFTSYLPAGTYVYEYTARATTPGEFVVPPARAEEIYAPEVFGRSASATVVVD